MSDKQTPGSEALTASPSHLTRRTFLPIPALICNGDSSHYAPMPTVYADGIGGPVHCSECGATMSVVDIITVEPEADWSSLRHLSRGRRYFGV